MKKLLISSDIHLGSPVLKDFDRLFNLFKYQSYDKLILLGDIFDSWEKPFEKIVNEYSEFSKFIIDNSKNIEYIVGNHDPKKEEIRECFPNLNISDHLIVDEKYYLCHGHQFNNTLFEYVFFGKPIFWIQWLFEKFGINLRVFLRKHLDSVSNKMNKPYFIDLINDIEETAIKEFINEYKGLAMGHTHRSKQINYRDTENDEKRRFSYVNVGDWIDHKEVCFLKEGKFRIKNFDGGRPISPSEIKEKISKNRKRKTEK